MSNYVDLKAKLDDTLSLGQFAIVERHGNKHAIRLSGNDTVESYSLIHTIDGQSWVERDSLYTWALWNAEFIKYVDSLK